MYLSTRLQRVRACYSLPALFAVANITLEALLQFVSAEADNPDGTEVPSQTAYQAVPFQYNNAEQDEPTTTIEEPVPAAPSILDVPFVPSFAVPAAVRGHLPETDRMHKVQHPSLVQCLAQSDISATLIDKLCCLVQIILQTAKYVRQAGGQTEFVLRVRQAGNSNFSFLDPNNHQYPYFRWLVSTKPEVSSCLLQIQAAAQFLQQLFSKSQ